MRHAIGGGSLAGNESFTTRSYGSIVAPERLGEGVFRVGRRALRGRSDRALFGLRTIDMLYSHSAGSHPLHEKRWFARNAQQVQRVFHQSPMFPHIARLPQISVERMPRDDRAREPAQRRAKGPQDDRRDPRLLQAVDDQTGRHVTLRSNRNQERRRGTVGLRPGNHLRNGRLDEDGVVVGVAVP